MPQTFQTLWKNWNAEERDNISVALAKKCNIAIKTVSLYGYGLRKPKSKSQHIIVRHLNSTFELHTTPQELFPN